MIAVIVNVKYLYKQVAMPKAKNTGKRKASRNYNSPYATGTGRSTADVAETDDQVENGIQQVVQEAQQSEQPTISAGMAAFIKAKVDDLLASEGPKIEWYMKIPGKNLVMNKLYNKVSQTVNQTHRMTQY